MRTHSHAVSGAISYITNCTIDMYADDTLIYVCHKDINVIENCLNENLVSD